MPVATVSADQVSWVNGRPKIVKKANKNGKKPSNLHDKGNNAPSAPSARPNTKYECRAEQRKARLELVTPGSPVAVDCEGVILARNVGWRRQGVGRISIVNVAGQVVYDTFVYYPAHIEHRPSPQRLKLGVTKQDIRPQNGAQPLAKVLAAAKAIFDKSGIVVAHTATNDVHMLDGIDFDKYVVRDTQLLYDSSYGHSLPALSSLSNSVLHRNIQSEEHSSVEDARATMDLFLAYRDGNESDCDHAGQSLSPGCFSSDEDTCTTTSATQLELSSLVSDLSLSGRTTVDSSPYSSSSEVASGHPLANDRVFNREPSTCL